MLFYLKLTCCLLEARQPPFKPNFILNPLPPHPSNQTPTRNPQRHNQFREAGEVAEGGHGVGGLQALG